MLIHPLGRKLCQPNYVFNAPLHRAILTIHACTRTNNKQSNASATIKEIFFFSSPSESPSLLCTSRRNRLGAMHPTRVNHPNKPMSVMCQYTSIKWSYSCSTGLKSDNVHAHRNLTGYCLYASRAQSVQIWVIYSMIVVTYPVLTSLYRTTGLH